MKNVKGQKTDLWGVSEELCEYWDFESVFWPLLASVCSIYASVIRTHGKNWSMIKSFHLREVEDQNNALYYYLRSIFNAFTSMTGPRKRRNTGKLMRLNFVTCAGDGKMSLNCQYRNVETNQLWTREHFVKKLGQVSVIQSVQNNSGTTQWTKARIWPFQK